MRTCQACGVTSADFDRTRSICKPCRRAEVRAIYATRQGAWTERNRQWRQDNPDQFRVIAGRWKQRYPDAHRLGMRARAAVYRALRKGVLTRPETCSKCGAGGLIEAAHGDYLKPLDVRWLCQSCHRRWDITEPKLKPSAA